MTTRVQSYRTKLEIQRNNDGTYYVEVSMNGNIQKLTYATRMDLFTALAKFEQDLTDYETNLDA